MDTPLRSPVALTAEGRRWLQERLDDARGRLARLARASEGEPSDELSADRHQLTEEVEHLTAVLRDARLVDERADDGAPVDLGDEVEVQLPDARRERLWIVHPLEAGLDEQRTSADTPLAAAVLGARAGDRVTVTTPAGVYHCTVLSRRRRA